MATELVRSLQPQLFYSEFLKKGVRPDGRTLRALRPAKVSKGVFTQPDGSSSVRYGNTRFAVGVRAEVGSSLWEASNRIVVNCEFSPLCGDIFQEHHKAKLQESFLSESLSEVLNSPSVLDNSQFKISDDAAWVLYLEVVCLEYDGNGFDPALLACIAAIQNTQLMGLTFNENSRQFECVDEIKADIKQKTLKIKQAPMPITFASVENEWLVDPTLSDEQAGSVVSLCRVANDWMVLRLPGAQINPMVFVETLFPLAMAYLPKVKKVLETASNEN